MTGRRRGGRRGRGCAEEEDKEEERRRSRGKKMRRSQTEDRCKILVMKTQHDKTDKRTDRQTYHN